MSFLKASSTVILAMLLLTGCDTLDTDTFEPEVVVESYQIAGENLQPVRLSWTGPIADRYNVWDSAVRNARVWVTLLAPDGSHEARYAYMESEEPGLYVPVEPVPVEALRAYELEAELVDDGARVTSRTVVPGLFEVTAVSSDTVVFQSDEPFEVTITKSTYPSRQSIFIFTTESLTPLEELLTPLAKHFFEQAEHGVTLEDLRLRSSMPLNEESFEINPDATVTIRYPWLAVMFYGANRVTTSAIDDNLYDFIRSQSLQQGGSTLPPGEIPNVLDRVEGGTGVFGSLSRASLEVFIEREADAISLRAGRASAAIFSD